MKYGSVFKLAPVMAMLLTLVAGTAVADRPAKEELRETVPVREAPRAPQAVPAAGCYTRLSGGYAVWFFRDEDSTGAPGMYFDYWCADVPVNFRVGVEGRHMDISQGDAANFAEAPGEATETSLVRIPFELAYYDSLGEGLTGYLGLGPDIWNSANDINDTSVGLHLGARVHYAFDDNWGASLEGGYMWDEISDSGSDFNLDGWYLTPAIAYTF